MKKTYYFFLGAMSIGSLFAADAQQQTLENQSSLPTPPPIKFVAVGDANNKADSTGHGAVNYAYGMGTCDVTAKEYCEFLNAVASHSDPYALYSRDMTFDPTSASIKKEEDLNGVSHYSVIENSENFPITNVSLYSAARYCNWLNNGKPVGNEGAGTTETGAYDLQGAMNGPLFRKEGALYFLPNRDEWYKAAYYDAANGSYYSFPTRSGWSPKNSHNTSVAYDNEANYDGATKGELRVTPVGYFATSMSPYGLYDMGGNVNQWTETPATDADQVVICGGSWASSYRYGGLSNDLESSATLSADAQQGSNTIGFRVATKNVDNQDAIVLSAQPDAYSLTPTEAALVGGTGLALATGGAYLYAEPIKIGCIAAGAAAYPYWESLCNKSSDCYNGLVEKVTRNEGNSAVVEDPSVVASSTRDTLPPDSLRSISGTTTDDSLVAGNSSEKPQDGDKKTEAETKPLETAFVSPFPVADAIAVYQQVPWPNKGDLMAVVTDTSVTDGATIRRMIKQKADLIVNLQAKLAPNEEVTSSATVDEQLVNAQIIAARLAEDQNKAALSEVEPADVHWMWKKCYEHAPFRRSADDVAAIVSALDSNSVLKDLPLVQELKAAYASLNSWTNPWVLWNRSAAEANVSKLRDDVLTQINQGLAPNYVTQSTIARRAATKKGLFGWGGFFGMF